MFKRLSFVILFLLTSTLLTVGQDLPSPKQFFGFSIGDNYKLATYTQTEAYFKKIASA